MLVPSALLPLVLPLPVLAQGNVLVVDPAGGPGVDSTSLSGAVAAASDGDVVLVRSGIYADPDGIPLDGKGVLVVADAGASVETEYVRVRNLPAASQVLVQGIEFRTFEHLSADLFACAGPLWFEDCAFLPEGPSLLAGGVFPTGCDALVLARCSAQGVTFISPSTALVASDSRLHLHESTVQGVANGLQAALELFDGSFLELFGSTVHGGDGAMGQLFHCDGFDGGDAVLLGTGTHARVLGSTVVGGAGGPPLSGCNPGANGAAYVQAGGELELLAGSARSFSVTSPVRDDELLTLTFTGQPGDQIWLRVSGRAGTGTTSSFYEGQLLLGTPRFGFRAGTLPASGTGQVSLPAPDLAPGVESTVFFCQAIFRDAVSGSFLVSTPGAVVVVDDVF